MMSFQEGIQYLEEQRYEEAYQYFKAKYQETKELLCKYYYCILKFNNLKEIDLEQDYQEFVSLFQLPKKYHTSLYYPMVFFTFYLEKYREAKYYSKKFLDEVAEDPFVYHVYGQSILNVDHDRITAKEILQKVLNFDDISSDLIDSTYHALCTILLDMDQIEEAKELLNKMYIQGISPNVTYPLELLIAVKEKKSEEILNYLEKIKNLKVNYEFALNAAYCYFYDQRIYDVASKLIEEILASANFNDFYKKNTYLDSIYIDLDLKKYEEGLRKIAETESYEDDFKMRVDYLKADLLRGIDPLKYKVEIIGLYKSIFYDRGELDGLKSLITYLFDLGCYDEMYFFAKAAMKFYRTTHHKPDYYLYYFYSYFHRYHGLYNKAVGEVSTAFNHKMIDLDSWIHEMISIGKRNKTLNQLYKTRLSELKDDWSKRYYAIIQLEGLFGAVKHPEIALQFRELYEAHPDTPCYIVSYAKSIQPVDPVKAFELYREGSNLYLNNKNNCSCAIPFYSLCLYHGIGTEKNSAEAKKIIDDFIVENHAASFTKENMIFVRNHYRLLEDDQLSEGYQEVQKVYTRYSLTKIVLLMRFETKLFGKILKRTNKLYKKLLIHCGLAERVFYQDKSNEQNLYLTLL